MVKSKDYEDAGEIEAATPYAAWKLLGAEHRALAPGDVLEIVTGDGAPGELTIVKYVGFEPAKWYVPEPKAETGTQSPENLGPAVPESHSHPL